MRGFARLDTRYPGVLLTLRWGPLWAYAGAQPCQVSSALLSLLCGQVLWRTGATLGEIVREQTHTSEASGGREETLPTLQGEWGAPVRSGLSLQCSFGRGGVYVRMHACSCAMACRRMSEDNLWELVLPPVCLGDQTQATRLGSKFFYLPRPLTSSPVLFLDYAFNPLVLQMCSLGPAVTASSGSQSPL